MRRILLLLVIGFGVWYFFVRPGREKPAAAPAPDASAPLSSYDCVLLAEKANSALVAASAVSSRPPVDPNEWTRVEGDARSAIRAAESACTSTSPDLIRALSLMRESLNDFASAARGEGGATAGAQRQEQIYDLLNRARGR